MGGNPNAQDTGFTRGCKDSTINTAREITAKLRDVIDLSAWKQATSELAYERSGPERFLDTAMADASIRFVMLEFDIRWAGRTCRNLARWCRDFPD